MESINEDLGDISPKTACQKFDNFLNLPLEIKITIFQYLNSDDFEQCLKVCKTWRNFIFKSIFATKLCGLAKKYEGLRTVFQNEGWCEDCDDDKIILRLYYEHRYYSSKF